MDKLSAANIVFPSRTASPARALGVRLIMALILIGLVTGVAYADRGGYKDVDGSVSLLDASTTRRSRSPRPATGTSCRCRIPPAC